MLVVNRHTLQTIDFLHLRDEEVVECRRPEDFQDFVWVSRTFSKVLPFVNHVAGLHNDVLTGRDQMLFFLTGLLVFHDELALSANRTFERHDAIDTGHFGSILRTTSFEKLSDTRKTTGDVLRLRGLTRSFGEQGTRSDDIAFVDCDLRANRN